MMGPREAFTRSYLGNKYGRFPLLILLAAISTISLYFLCDNCDLILPIHRRLLQNYNVVNDHLDIACKFPYLDPFNPTAMKYYQKYPTSGCPDGLATVTFYDGEKVVVDKILKEKNFDSSTLSCWYRSVTFHISYVYSVGEWVGPFSDYISVNDRPPFVEVKCLNEQGDIVSRMHHYITRGEKRRSESHAQHSFKIDQMNVMLIGMDSLSSHLFKRAMPKTRDYLLNTMGSVEMGVYNKVGDNTFPNLLAIASGKYEHEITGWTRAQSFDDVPFIWKEFKSAGYRTQYISDRADFNTFSKPPTDCYNNPMAVALMRNKIAFDNNCFEDQIEINMWLNLIKEFALESLHSTGRFFSLAMFKRPTHDFPNQASAVDDHYTSFFQEIFSKSILNNTFLVFFGDHGPRCGNYRATFEGSIEERSSNMIVYVPAWFKLKHKRLYQNLLINVNRLITNFDIHETLRNLLTLDNLIDNKTSGTLHVRGLSLFLPVPRSRTCTDADISPHFCMCNGGVPMATDDRISTTIGEEVVRNINSLTDRSTDKCATNRLKTVTSLSLINGSVGGNGIYRVMITTSPGGAAFEATVQYSVTLYFFTTVKPLGMISRTSMYRGLSDCVLEDKMLQMYCYCKDLL